MRKRIDLILVEKKIVETRNKAQAMIMAGQIIANGQKVIKSGEIHNFDSEIKIINLRSKWVSRGGLKLSHVIKYFNIKIKDLICLDIGASTGGFTDVLLENEAKKIFAVDVGFNQLHEKIKENKKVVNIEKTNARYLNRNIINDCIDLIVCDASFISIKKVLKPSLNLLKTNGNVIALIKPQFEVSKKEIKKGGVVKDSLIHQRICSEISSWFEDVCYLQVKGITASPIKGPKGNIEFFIFAEKIK